MTGPERPAQPVHVDTDPGLDDVLALALALASPELHVASVTTVAGNASIEAVTANALRFLTLAGAHVPVGRGAAAPLALGAVTSEPYHGADGLGGIVIPALDGRPTPPADHVLREALASGEVERIVALGPLTNLALFHEHEPELLRGIEIVWMGGSLSGGNISAAAEFNCYADPVAARALLTAGLDVRVVGLDVTRLVRLVPADVPAGSFGDTELGRLVERILCAQMRAEEPLYGRAQATLHDPCALLAALPTDLFRWEPKRLDVIVDEGGERGRLVELPAERDEPALVQYAVEVDAPRVAACFTERLRAWCRSAP